MFEMAFGLALLVGLCDVTGDALEDRLTEACVSRLLPRDQWHRAVAAETKRLGVNDCKLIDRLQTVEYDAARAEVLDMLDNQHWHWSIENRVGFLTGGERGDPPNVWQMMSMNVLVRGELDRMRRLVAKSKTRGERR